MNQESEVSQVSQSENEDQPNPHCPYKPKIPYMLSKSFVPKQEQASYLQKKELDNTQRNSSQILIGTSYTQPKKEVCCEKLTKINQVNKRSMESQIKVMAELSLLITDHSKLLEKMISQKHHENNTQQETNHFITKELTEKDKLLKEWKDKWDQEHNANGDRNAKIKELQKQIKEIEEQISSSTVNSSLQDEVNTWKNKFISLNKNYNETHQKLIVLEGELDMLQQNSKSGSLRQSGVQSTTTTTTTTRKRGTIRVDDPIIQQQLP